MSEQDKTISTEDDDVELHKKKQVMASDEKRDEAAPEEDDVELHGRRGLKAQ